MASRLPRFESRSQPLFFLAVIFAASGIAVHGQALFALVLPRNGFDLSINNAASIIGLELAVIGLFASVDVHNNTGLNPHYACVNRVDDRFFQLATLFGRTVVYFIRPRGVQSMALAELCPAVTLECGQVGQSLGVAHATDFLDACLHLAEIPDHPVAAHDMDLFHTVAVVRIPDGVPFGFEPVAGGLHLVQDSEASSGP